jgi:hypothetical protein
MKTKSIKDPLKSYNISLVGFSLLLSLGMISLYILMEEARDASRSLELGEI